MSGVVNRERRKSRRESRRLSTSYSLKDGKRHSAETKDISEDGILLMVSGDVKKGAVLHLELHVGPGRQTVKTLGRVVHISKRKTATGTVNLAGVAFLEPGEKQHAAIGKKIWEEILKGSTRLDKES